MKLSKFYRQAVASLESQAREEVRASLKSGPYSDVQLAVEAHVTEAAQNAAEVVTSLHEAMEMHSDAAEVREVTVEALSLRDGVEAVNANGGFTTESLDWANEAAAAVFDRVGGFRPFKAPSLESLTETTRFVVSTEDFDAVTQAIDAARSDVAAKSLDGIARVFGALEDAMPEIRDRMQALKNTLGSVEYDEEKHIRLDDYITKQLSVNGQVPSSLKDYLLGYGRFADALLGAYSENALEAASKAPELGNCLSQLQDDACPIEALNCVLKAIGDPRSAIAPDQLGFVLPGSGPLFGASMDDDCSENVPEGPAGDLQVRMHRFCLDHVPLDPVAYTDRPDVEVNAADEAPTIRVLSKDTICCGLEILIRLIDSVNIKTYAEARRDAWVKARSSFERYRQALQSVTPTQANNLRPLLSVVGEYCDTLFTLSAWPALHFMANLVFTSNAFVLLAERSIAGRTEEVEVVENEDGMTDVAVDEEGNGVAGADLPTGDDAGGGDLTDTTGEPAAAPDAIPDGDVGVQAMEPSAPEGAEGAAPAADEVQEPEAAEATPEATVVPETAVSEEPAAEPAAPAAPEVPGEEAPIPPAADEEPEVPEGGAVIPPASEETPVGTDNVAEVIPPASEEEEAEEEGDVIPNAEEEEEEEEEAR